MSNQRLTIEIPTDLLKQAENAKIDIREALIETLSIRVGLVRDSTENENLPAVPFPSDAAIQQAIDDSLRVFASGAEGLRKFDLHKGPFWVSPDFDDELPDEFWFGDNDPS